MSTADIVPGRAGATETAAGAGAGPQSAPAASGAPEASYVLPDPSALTWDQVARIEELTGVSWERWEADLGRAAFARAALDASGQLSWAESGKLRPADVIATLEVPDPKG